MTALRRSIGALVAICVAFAAGIALGNGPLQGSFGAGHSSSVSRASDRLTQRLVAVRSVAAFDEAMARAAGPALLQHRLATTSVGLVVLPGVPASTVTGVSRAVTLSGGEITVLARLRSALLDPDKKTYVDSVATNSLRGPHRRDLAQAAALPTYERIGALIARAYTGTSDDLAVDEESTGLDAQLQGARLLSLAHPLQRRASAVIVLAAAEHGSTDSVYAEHQIESAVIEALAGSCDGLLVAGPLPATAPGGLLADLAADRQLPQAISTLDVVATPAGQLATPLVLAAQVAGQPGRYGVVDGTVRLPSADARRP